MKCPFVIKVCSKCKRILVANGINFGKDKKCKYGLCSMCKECKNKYLKEYNKQYYEDNKEHLLEYQKLYQQEHKKEKKEYLHQYYESNKEGLSKQKKQYYENNKEEILEKQKRYYEDNKEEILEKCKKYRDSHKEEYKEYYKQYYEDNKNNFEFKEKRKQYYDEHKEEIKKYHKQWVKNNPDKTLNNCNKRRQLEENQGNGIDKEQWLEMMEFFNWKCAYSGEYIGGDSDKRTIDHIIPLSKGGKHEIWNCIPCYANYNYSKYTRDMLEWYQEQEFYSKERLNKIYEWIEYAFEKWGNRDE